MRVMTGTVVAGKVVLDESAVAAEGANVWVVMPEAQSQTALSLAELAEVEAGIAEADRGEMVEGHEWLAGLRRRNGR